MKKILALTLALALALSMTACGGASSSTAPAPADSTSAAPAAKGNVYFFNFKPEQDEAYQAIAKEYTAETGVPVKVVTAASGTYEQSLKSEIAKTEAPTIFQINGPVGYAAWKDYCADLSKTEIYGHLTDKTIAISEGEGVYGIPFAIEGYGIIYNNAIMTKYFALDGAKAKSMDEINNFAKLKEVVEDMTAKKADLGIEGVFSSTSLAPGEDWRWQTHLANVPFYYEFSEGNLNLSDPAATAEIKFAHSENYKNIFDLYVNNSVTEKGLLGSTSVDDSMAEFALGQSAMVQNGNWAYGQISGVDGNVVTEADVKFMPIYTGIAGEEKQGLCSGTENFFCINKNAKAEDQQASIDFMTWLYTSDAGKAHVTSELGFIAPFDTFSDAEKPTDPLAKEVLAWTSKEGFNNVPWNFTIFPSQAFKDKFGADLLQYVQGSMEWDALTKDVVDTWASEKAATATA
ncbi:MAG: ABC transporter substrate-binding protein [Ruthenibacterium sp.]